MNAATTTEGLGTLSAQGLGQHLSTARKLALSAVVVSSAAAVVTHGSGATFSASASRGHQITTGNPSLALGLSGTPANRLNIDVTSLVPGGSAYRAFTITNTGSQTFTNYTLSVTATTSSLLDTDQTNGVQAKLQSCPTAWQEGGTYPDYTYTCSGTPATVTSGPIIQSATPLSGMASATPNGTDYLLLTEMLPATADGRFVGLTSAVTYIFNAS